MARIGHDEAVLNETMNNNGAYPSSRGNPEDDTWTVLQVTFIFIFIFIFYCLSFLFENEQARRRNRRCPPYTHTARGHPLMQETGHPNDEQSRRRNRRVRHSPYAFTARGHQVVQETGHPNNDIERIIKYNLEVFIPEEFEL